VNHQVLNKLKIKWIYGICAIFIVLNCIFIANEFYWFSLVPVILLIILFFIFSLDKLLLVIVFLTPLSINMVDFENNFRIILPTEPLLFGVMLLFFIKLIYEGGFDRRILKHPVTITIIIYLFWIFMTSLTSSLPLVSFKFFIAKLWFIIPFYFFGTQLFKNPKNIRRFIWMYILSLLIVVFYAIYVHSDYGFNEQTAHWVMSPFYNDHTAYGAVLAMFTPFALGFVFDKKLNKTQKTLSFLVFIIFIIAIILSYSRAAWLSLAVALIIFLILKWKINYKIIVAGCALLVGIFYVYKDEIIFTLEKNRQDSSKDYVEHIQSMSNISSDASNLERINRWDCAFRMFKERPVFGWGPGTYQFKYAPFQLSQEKTTISTNAGDKGNAHSEYIGPLAEEGILGILSVFAIVIFVSYTAVKVYKRSKSPDVKFFSIISIISLFTYFVHGFMNNFLDTDKASVPFWGLVALIVTLDVYYRNENSETTDLRKQSEGI
jgi:putative inorganic carbon (HCO3(-)) transporter